MITKAESSFIASIFFIVITFFSNCGKKDTTAPPPNPTDTTTIAPQVDPSLAPTIGFFMDDWEPKNFTIPSSLPYALTNRSNIYSNVDRSNVITKIPRSIAGNNANIWMTQMVTEPPLMDHLTTLASSYHSFSWWKSKRCFFLECSC